MPYVNVRLTYVTEIWVFEKSGSTSFLGVVFYGESHGDLRFGSKCRRYAVMTKPTAPRGHPLYRLLNRFYAPRFLSGDMLMHVRVPVKLKGPMSGLKGTQGL